MKKMNPYSHLLLRMTAVLVIVATAAFLNHPDADVKADAGNNISSNKQGVLIPVTDTAQATVGVMSEIYSEATPDESREETGEIVSEITQIASQTPNGASRSEDKPEDSGQAASASTLINDGGVEGGVNDTDTAVDPDRKDEANEGTGTGAESTDTDTAQADTEGTDNGSDTENADRTDDKAVVKITDKNSPEYVDSLLVTSPEHYDAKVVESARSIPTASDNDRYLYITGTDKKVYTVGHMPDGFKNGTEASAKMVTLDVPVWKMTKSGEKYSSYWPITINENLADSIRCIFSDIYLLDMKFPFNYLVGYTYRKVGGVGLVNSKLMSTHAFGVALDINLGDFDNDYFLGKGNDLRDKSNPYCIPDEVIEIFERYGWFWGGNYDICADTMHFQYFELGFLQYDSDEPFPILSYGAKGMSGTVIRNMTQRLVKLGYLDRDTSSFTKKVDAAVRAFQEEHGLEADGIVDYETWEPMINLTHYMEFVF